MKWSEVPIPVLVSGGIIAAAFLVFVISFPFVSSGRDEVMQQNRQLTNELRSANSAIDTARNDYNFVEENELRFEEAMSSDEIIPHTRRAAARQMQTVALENGLTSLNYNFGASSDGRRGRGQAAQPESSDAYSLHVENLTIDVGAPVDRSVYGFIEELVRSIPGTIVLRELTLQRAENVTTEMLNNVARGQNSGIVDGTVVFSWRTAQANREAEQ